MKRKAKAKLKDIVISVITAYAFLFMFASLMSMAEGCNKALIVFALSAGWIWLFCKANQETLE